MKTLIKILLGIAVVMLSYLCVMSVVTPIRFDNTKAERDAAVVARLIQIRTVEVEFKNQFNHYTADWDSLINFVRTGQKKEVMKEGALTEAQLESGLTEAKAVKIVQSGKMKDIIANGLENFKRDTIYTPLLKSLFDGVYTEETIANLALVPWAGGEKEGNGTRFELEVNNEYVNGSGINIPLFEARTPFDTYLNDLDHQQLVNLKDEAKTLERYPGMKVGSVDEPNNNSGNWE